MDISGDLQCQAILTGLRNLEDVLSGDLASKALDLVEKATTSRQKDLLIRLKRSLEQYVERTGDLVYVAMIGHFSSGKSSTINSLIDLWGQPDQRDVDLNPTDKAITLITHEKNATSLLGVINQGQGSVPIKMQPIESDLLKGIVLADTPGTGDPQLLEELARDFLPICDIVLFFFSAASPLDTTDIPLLMELHRRLPFIPLRFVITRADELRSDPRQPVSNSNFDIGRAASFIANVMSRISLLLKPSKYSEKDFLLIDNLAQYNIATLRNELLSRADPTNLSNRISMHSHKVKFFQKTADSLCRFFSSFLEAKIIELNRVVSTAEKNIQKYNEAVTIANSNLTKNWFVQLHTLQELKSRADERTKKLIELPASLFNYEPVTKLLSEVGSDITRVTRSVAEGIQEHVKQTGLEQLKRNLSQLKRTLAAADLDTMTPQDHGLSPITIEWALGDAKEIVQVHYLARKADEVREKLGTTVMGLATDTQRFVEDIQRAIQQRQILSTCEDIVADAQGSLARDLDSYFQSVQVYRTGVVAMTSMSSIAKLGIGEELDQIGEFTDEDKESIKLTTKQALFPSFDEILAAATTKLAAISERVRSILSEAGGVQFGRPPTTLPGIELTASEQLLSFIQEVRGELQRETDLFITGLQEKLSGVIGTVQLEYGNKRDAATRARNLRYLMLIAAAGVITLTAYLIYHWIRRPVGQSLLEVIGWSTLASLLGNVIGLGVARFRDNYPETKRQIKAQYAAILNSEINTTINEALKTQQISVLETPALVKRLGKIYTELSSLPKDSWQCAVEEQYRIVRAWVAKYQEIRRSYLAVVQGFAKDCARYFEDSEQNLATLRSAADSIKGQAIQPSFELLARTSNQLQQVKDEIDAIRFD